MRAPEFWHMRNARGLAGALAIVLSPLGWAYGAITSMRASRAPEYTAPVPVICIGNVVMGGAGKTLVCADLAKRLSAKGHKPHIIMHGYGGLIHAPTQVDLNVHGAKDVGDEPLLLARLAPTWVGRNRAEVAKRACEAGASVIIMDDGFQNSTLAKTLSLLVVDTAYGFGNGRVCPAGPLRETTNSAVKRADGIIALGNVRTALKFDLPIFAGQTNATMNAPDIQGKRVIAFAGIGRPDKFFDTLKAAGAELVETISFPDHHPFLNSEVEAILSKATANNCIVVTTEKDIVRIPTEFRTGIMSFPVELTWEHEDAFERFILERTGLS